MLPAKRSWALGLEEVGLDASCCISSGRGLSSRKRINQGSTVRREHDARPLTGGHVQTPRRLLAFWGGGPWSRTEPAIYRREYAEYRSGLEMNVLCGLFFSCHRGSLNGVPIVDSQQPGKYWTVCRILDSGRHSARRSTGERCRVLVLVILDFVL